MVEAVGQYHDLVRRDAFEVMPEKLGRVLDVGGGIGATSVALKHAGRADRVVVVDQVADHVLPDVDRAFAGDLEDPAFLEMVVSQAGEFDTILCLDVLEHLRDPWSAVDRLRQCLAPGGAIIASIPNVNYLGLVGPLVLRGRYDLADAGILDRTHLRWFVKDTAVALMNRDGLKVEAVVDRVPRTKYRVLSALSLGVLKRFFVMQFLIRARAA
jgi:2-polyprenyl-3-methyl-5-hydroxy-6-metoxy-1,4-benzoquinol methylase